MFVSFDALLVWLGVVTALVLIPRVRRARRTALP